MIQYDLKNKVISTQDFRKVWGNMPFPAVRTEGLGYDSDPSSYIEEGRPQFSSLQIGELNFSVDPIITVSGRKHIVKTPVAGRRFTVKEIISVEDYSINIKGFLLSDEVLEYNGMQLHAADFPASRVKQLRELFELNTSLEVRSNLLSLFNINQLVIEEINFPFVAGYENAAPFELRCVSDEDVELELIDNGTFGDL